MMSYTISTHGGIWKVNRDDAVADLAATGNLFPTKEAAEEELARRIALWNEKYNPPTKRITTSFEVKLHDEPRTYTWTEAMAEFDNNPDSEWRLPTKEELAIIYQKRDEIGGFTSIRKTPCGSYWSSSEYNNLHSWFQQFSDGVQFILYKHASFAARLVRKKETQA